MHDIRLIVFCYFPIYRNGRLQTWVWGQRQEVYSYDSRGLLTETRSPDASAGSRTISYGPYNLVNQNLCNLS